MPVVVMNMILFSTYFVILILKRLFCPFFFENEKFPNFIFLLLFQQKGERNCCSAVRCQGSSGHCTKQASCNGNWQTGYCPGFDGTVRCCTAKASVPPYPTPPTPKPTPVIIISLVLLILLLLNIY